MGVLQNLEGKKFNHWRVLHRVGSDKRGNATWRCKCVCGKEKVIESSCLRKNISISCGCVKKQSTYTYSYPQEFKGHKLLSIWKQMLSRCYDITTTRYEDWGGRGIKVCEEWLEFGNFLIWASKQNTEGLQLDRIDNDKNYSAGNCRFVTPQTNSNNRRVNRLNRTGYEGVYLRKSGKFRAYIRSNKSGEPSKLLHLGTFDTASSAVMFRNDFIKTQGLPHKIQEVK